MRWIEISVSTVTTGVEPLTGALMQAGVAGFVIEDKEDFKAFLKDAAPRWDYIDPSLLIKLHAETRVKFYLPENAQGLETLRLVAETLERLKREEGEALGPLALSTDYIREEDWEWGWKQHFKPFPVGEKLFVCPSWEQAEHPGGRILLRIDPGSAFGTGQHETTKLCLELLERAVFPGCSVLDLGTGSGILSVAALLLGASFAAGVDVDENAVATALKNAGANGVEDGRFAVFTGDPAKDEGLRSTLSARPFDIVAANIVADVILALAPYFRDFLKPRGTLIVSGILAERADEVARTLAAAGFSPAGAKADGGWAAAMFSKV